MNIRGVEWTSAPCKKAGENASSLRGFSYPASIPCDDSSCPSAP